MVKLFIVAFLQIKMKLHLRLNLQGKTIVLPVFRYKGLTVTVNSKNATVLKQGGPFVTVKSESGINKVTIRYSYTFFLKSHYLFL